MALVHVAAFVLIVAAAWLLAPAQAAATVPGAADERLGQVGGIGPEGRGVERPGVLSMTLGVYTALGVTIAEEAPAENIEPPGKRRHTQSSYPRTCPTSLQQYAASSAAARVVWTCRGARSGTQPRRAGAAPAGDCCGSGRYRSR